MSKTTRFSQQALVLRQLFERAIGFHQRGQLKEAEAAYLQILQLEKGQFEARHLLGVLRGQQGRHHEALELIGAALKAKPDWVAALANYGLVLQKLGRCEDALVHQDRALALQPDYFEALNNRGNVLAELRRYEEALASYERALALRPRFAETLNNRGNALAALGSHHEALASYDLALAARPDHPEALNNRGSVLAALDRYGEALASFDRALTLAPTYAEALNNRGSALSKLKRYQEALASFDRALAARPGYADAFYNRGNTLAELKQLEAALEAYDQALAVRPDYVVALDNRGNVLLQLRRYEEALASFDHALEIMPEDVEGLNGRANVLQELLRYEEALASYDKALSISADDAHAHYNRGVALQQLNRLDEGLASYDRALAMKPDHVQALYNRGNVLHAMNRLQEAEQSYSQALALKPDFAEAKFALCMAQLPVLYKDEAEIAPRRAAYRERLGALCQEADRARAPELAEGVGASQPYLLAYQGHNDRDLQALYGSVVCRIVAERYPAAALPDPPSEDEPVRVGIVSGFFRRHSNWKIPIKGWLTQLDRRRFRLFGYHTGGQVDSETKAAAALCERFVQGPLSVDRWRDAILADSPHVLIYPEVGMDPVSVQLAAQRLAPVQCNSWGHPDSSGFPTLDYYLSSDLMEPPEGQESYTEKLIRLPNLSIFYEPLDTPAVPLDRLELGLRPSATVYWCSQSISKYLPQFDEVFPRIAREVGDCQFTFIQYPGSRHVNELFWQRLERAFAAFGLQAADHCCVMPRLESPRFIAALGRADIFLDSIGWSGCNSTFDSLRHDLPIVTMVGELMRGRHTMAILTMMGVTDTITSNVDDYVATAIRLARDPEWRMAVKSRISVNKHRVYRDGACISVLEEFLDRAARKGSEE